MKPSVSVIVANYNGERYLAVALRSILAQSCPSLEILLVDDASTDGSLAIAEGIAAEDSRLRIFVLTENRGPAAARNHGLTRANGDWVAVVDSDDFIHPDRLQLLLNEAAASGADIVADDQLVFDDAGRRTASRLLCGARATASSWISASQYVDANRLFGKTAVLGYLKPLIRRSVLLEHEILYNEALKNAEDYDLILRLLVRGARFRLLPELLYFYRRHEASISHRLADGALQAMLTEDAGLRRWAGVQAAAPLRAALDKRCASIRTAQAVEAAIAALKDHAFGRTLGILATRPAAVPVVAQLFTPGALLARWRRGAVKAAVGAPAAAQGRGRICVLSRQRLMEGVNGSTAYLLSLCRHLQADGFTLELVCPSPVVLGRVPVLRVAGNGDVFERVAIRGTFRFGRMFFARNPRVYAAAALAVLDGLARKAGIKALARFNNAAPYAVAAPWTAEDFLFVAQQSGGTADVVLADYAFLTPGIPFAARPGAASAVVMHDLFSSRPSAFAALGTADSVAALDAVDEAALLAKARLVIAIQQDEAEVVRAILPPGHETLTAPMALQPLAVAQPGENGGLLFVGSGTAPNVDGMRWFLAEIWPVLRELRPALTLTLAGAIGAQLGNEACRPGIEVLGRVADLAPLYAKADIVISPLRAGSGLKIKLVEALAHGKAVVATKVTVQGVADMVAGSVAVADTAPGFATEILRLLESPDLRATRAAAALAVAQMHFSAERSYAGVAESLRRQLGIAPPAEMTPAFVTPAFVTIVVPALNEALYIEACLTSLVGQCAPGRHEILVMDGGSTDGTQAIVEAFCATHPEVRLHANPARLQSAAVNLAACLAAAESTVLVRADAHAQYAPDFVARCLAALARSGATSVVVPMLNCAASGKGMQRAIATAQSSLLGNGGAAHRARPVSRFVEHGHHAAFALAFFRAIGGYDESFTHNEDAELDVRAVAAGGRIWMCAEAPVLYYPRDRLDSLARQYFRHGHGRIRTLRKHRMRPRLRQLMPLGALGSCAAGLELLPVAPDLAALALAYPALCLGWGTAAAWRQRDARLAWGGPALMVMHLAWASGFLAGLMRRTGGARVMLQENAAMPHFSMQRLALTGVESIRAGVMSAASLPSQESTAPHAEQLHS